MNVEALDIVQYVNSGQVALAYHGDVTQREPSEDGGSPESRQFVEEFSKNATLNRNSLQVYLTLFRDLPPKVVNVRPDPGNLVGGTEMS